jgi:acyl carrier protein
MTQALPDSGAMSAEIMDVILKEGGIEPARLTPEATFETLGLASIDVVMALLTIEEKYGVYIPLDNELSQAKNLGEFVERVARRVQAERAKSSS